VCLRCLANYEPVVDDSGQDNILQCGESDCGATGLCTLVTRPRHWSAHLHGCMHACMLLLLLLLLLKRY